MKYTSKRTFQLWSYTVGHNMALLRSPMMFKGDDDYHEARSFNVDIEFLGVTYIEIPSVLRGVAIFEIVNAAPPKLEYFLVQGSRLFLIESGGTNFYVVCGGIIIGENHWFQETRITDPFLEYEKILFSV